MELSIILFFGLFAKATSMQVNGTCCESLNEELMRLQTIEEEMIDTKKQFMEMKKSFEEVKTQLTIFEHKFERQNSHFAESSVVGFSASHTDGTGYYEAGDRVSFSVILSNFGDHFDPLTSIFTCPYRGIYFFTVSFNAHENDMIAYMKIGENVVSRAMASNDDGSIYNHGSAFVVIECMAGDEVWVECQKSGGQLYGYDKSAQFNGYLLSI